MCSWLSSSSFAAASPSGTGSARAVQNWLFDFGANTHITNDLAQVPNTRDYHGTDHVNGVVGGTGLHISKVGHFYIQTPHQSFRLSNTLYCPNATSTVISINHFTTDNKCSLTLSPTFYHVKDMQTGKILLHGPSRNGFYHFSSLSISNNNGIFACIGAHVSDSILHSHLGHPSSSIFKFLVARNKLPISGKVTSEVCHSCPLGQES